MQSEWQETKAELPWLLAAVGGITVAAAIGGYFISLPHHGEWLVDGWLRYTLWLMVGIPAIGCIVGATIRDASQSDEGPYPPLVSMGIWIFWGLSVAFLIGFLISQPHTDPYWFKQWITTTFGVFLAVIFLAILPGAPER